MLKSIVVFGLLLLSISVADSQPSAKITEYGRYNVKLEKLVPTENVSGGVEVVAKDEKHLQTTKKVPCRVEETFGYRIRFSGLSADRYYEVTQIVRHPAIKQPDGKFLKEQKSSAMVAGGVLLKDNQLMSWHFLKGFEYELVPGKWIREVYVDGKKVAGMTFDVVDVKATIKKDRNRQ